MLRKCTKRKTGQQKTAIFFGALTFYVTIDSFLSRNAKISDKEISVSR